LKNYIKRKYRIGGGVYEKKIGDLPKDPLKAYLKQISDIFYQKKSIKRR